MLLVGADAIALKLLEQCKLFNPAAEPGIASALISLISRHLYDAQLGTRLSKEDQKKFVEEYPESGIFKSYGATMRDYVLIPNSLLKSNKKVVTFYLKKGLSYVNTLKPK